MVQLLRKWKNAGTRKKLNQLGLTLSVFLFFSALVMSYINSRSGIYVPGNADVLFDRTVQMRAACTNIPPIRHLSATLNAQRLFYIAERYKLSYCRVAKAGSTFMTQMFMTLAGFDPQFHEYGDAKTMFDVPKDEVHLALKRNAALYMNAVDKRVQKTTSFLVARNPYLRLFSSYIDQIYLPNKWSAAKEMVSNPKRQECGNDVTFDEFLTSLSDSLLKKKMIDIHWAPIFSLCLPCETHIDIIVKQETFADDIDFILHYTGVDIETRTHIYRAAFANHRQISIPALIHTYVQKGHSANRGCISEQELAQKIWTAFQVQGYIHDDAQFQEVTFASVIREELEQTLVDAVNHAIHTKPLTDGQRVQQRHEWLLKFWKDIGAGTLKRIQAAYYEDFALFGYDIDPNTM